MKLYLLARKGNLEHNEVASMVVRAKTYIQARQLASENRGNELPIEWIDTEFSTCDEVKVEGEPGLILSDYIGG